MRKITNEVLTASVLRTKELKAENSGYEAPKWVQFSRELLRYGYILELYEARKTFSKYITVKGEDAKPFKVRFSNHKPIKSREEMGDCDFFVGISHLNTSTWRDAITAVHQHFEHKHKLIPIEEPVDLPWD